MQQVVTALQQQVMDIDTDRQIDRQTDRQTNRRRRDRDRQRKADRQTDRDGVVHTFSFRFEAMQNC